MMPSLADIERLVDEVDLKSFMLHYHIKKERDKARDNIDCYNIALMVKAGLDKKWQKEQEAKSSMTVEKWQKEQELIEKIVTTSVNKNGMGI